MVDNRIVQLANILTHHSVHIHAGDIIRVSGGVEAKPLLLEICKCILLQKATPLLHVGLEGYSYLYYTHATTPLLTKPPLIGIFEAQHTHGEISIGTETNIRELTTIDPKKIALRRKASKKISDIILTRDNWVYTEFPTPALAQEAGMSTTEFENFYYSAVLVDYNKLLQTENKVKKLFDKTTQVRILGEGTDLTLSLRGRTSVMCYGRRNLPDGEVYIAPVDDSAEGIITYSFPSIYSGREVDDIQLSFHKGTVVKAQASKNNLFLQEMLRTDPGAKRIGEFAIGLNYHIKQNIKQTLFDEKIGGTIHLALGNAYPKGGGKNVSAIHWDMVKDMRQSGKIYFDKKLVYQKGKFLPSVLS